jgi:hypothetical protein
VANKQQDRDRRARVEAMRREQQARERRKSMLFIVLAVLVGIGLVSAAVIPSYLQKRDDPANKDLSSFGVAAASAGCGEVLTVKGTNNDKDRKHVTEGTKEKYKTVPPSYGPHWPAPAYPARAFYTERDRPQMEQLVHNLEHGYTIVWYDKSIKGAGLSELKDLAASARETDAAGPGKKFIVSAWDESYGAFPSGKHIAMSHWGAQDSHRQLCGRVSGEAVSSFIEKYPSTDAPEPNAA